MDDLISRQLAINAIEKKAYRHTYLDQIIDIVSELPSAQPEPCEDAVSREAVSEWLKQYGQDVLHGKYKFSLMYIWKNLMELPSAQPEIIRCKDCRWQKDQSESTAWLPCRVIVTPSDFYCGRAERRTDADR